MFPQLRARLRRALVYVKAFAFLEEPPGAALAPLPAAAPVELSAACAGDRRRGPAAVRTARPGALEVRCDTSRAGAGRSGRPAAPPQRCATPVSGRRDSVRHVAGDRRASVPGGFLHR
ncbi:MAG: hypothetical protein Q8O67_11395 [Deltaproteobacteria bacterium]|nr:hypothetical protein [Deltaproteobacteria bacterium]